MIMFSIFMRTHPMHRLWDHNIVYQSQSQVWKLSINIWSADRIGAGTSVVKKKHEWNPIPGEELMEKHRDMEGERGKGDEHQHGW